jgi:MFS family permease
MPWTLIMNTSTCKDAVSKDDYRSNDTNIDRKSAGSSTGITFAIYNIGSIPAVFFSGPVNDYLGRRAGMFTGAVIVIIGTCIQAPSVNRGMFLAGRFILGLGVSFACVSAPCYVSEVCDVFVSS